MEEIDDRILHYIAYYGDWQTTLLFQKKAEEERKFQLRAQTWKPSKTRISGSSKYLGLLRIRDKDQCQICGKRVKSDEKPSVDHIIPRANGGSNELTNLRFTHLRCNILRSNKISAQPFLL